MPTWEEGLHICSAELLVDMLCNIFHMTYCDRKKMLGISLGSWNKTMQIHVQS